MFVAARATGESAVNNHDVERREKKREMLWRPVSGSEQFYFRALLVGCASSGHILRYVRSLRSCFEVVTGST